MLRKEIWAHLLAYNLVRKVMAQAAMEVQLNPRVTSSDTFSLHSNVFQ
jgi:hypothetical protein